MPAAENSKELSTLEPPADPGECAVQDAQIAGAASSDGKAEATPPIADGSFCQSHFSHFHYFLFFILIILLLLFCDVKVLHRLWWLINLGVRSLLGGYIRSKTQILNLQFHGADSCLSPRR